MPRGQPTVAAPTSRQPRLRPGGRSGKTWARVSEHYARLARCYCGSIGNSPQGITALYIEFSLLRSAPAQRQLTGALPLQRLRFPLPPEPEPPWSRSRRRWRSSPRNRSTKVDPLDPGAEVSVSRSCCITFSTNSESSPRLSGCAMVILSIAMIQFIADSGNRLPAGRLVPVAKPMWGVILP
jgi:hypothetical protein